MGWWSETIMGGDTPLDYLGYFADKIGVPCVYDSSYEGDEEPDNFHGHVLTREALEKRGVVAKFRKLRDRLRGDVIFGQVVGACFLWAGAKMPVSVKKEALVCANLELKGLDDAGWNNPDSRAGYLRDFIEKVEAHAGGGEKVELAYEGLMQKLADKIAGGE